MSSLRQRIVTKKGIVIFLHVGVEDSIYPYLSSLKIMQMYKKTQNYFALTVSLYSTWSFILGNYP